MSDRKLTVSVIIATRNRKDELLRCLESLFIQTWDDFELIIVDSSDDSLELILGEKIQKENDNRKREKNNNQIKFEYIYTNKASLPRQRNLGIKKARGDIVVFIDDDTVLEKDYLEQHRAIYTDDSLGQVMGCSGVIIGDKPHSKLVCFFRKVFMLTRPDKESKVLASGFYTICAFDFLTDTIKQAEILGGGNTSYKKEIFAEFLFDEHFEDFAPMEDADFSYRVSRKNKLIVAPKIRLYHYGTLSGKTDIRKRIIMLVLNHWYFIQKNMPHYWYRCFCFLWSEIGAAIYDLIIQGVRPCLYRIEGLFYLCRANGGNNK